MFVKMRIPNTININTLKTYDIPNKILNKCKNKIKSSNFEDWDANLPKSLQEICVETIARYWEENPILDQFLQTIDRCLLLDLLPVDLPLNLTIPVIDDEIFWRKCYLDKWPTKIPKDVAEIDISEIIKLNQSRNTSRSLSLTSTNISRKSSTASKSRSVSHDLGKRKKWKDCFLEMYVKEFLENIKPENYDPEKIKELSDLCGSYIKKLNIEQMQSSESSCSRIPLNAILTAFENLSDLSVCFKQKYVGDNFSWNAVQTSENDIKLLSKGLEKCRLQTLRILNSDIDCIKIEIILKPLQKHDMLTTIDLSHCKISDRGLLEIAKFLLDAPLKELYLSNNCIGVKGVEALCYALGQENCNLRVLNLKLNELYNEGGNILFQTLTYKDTNLKKLNVGACGFTKDVQIQNMLKLNKTLENLDLSNNHIEEDLGLKIIESLNSNSTIKKIDVRMCKLSSETEWNVQKMVSKPKKQKTKITSTENIEYFHENKNKFEETMFNIGQYFENVCP